MIAQTFPYNQFKIRTTKENRRARQRGNCRQTGQSREHEQEGT